MKTIAEIAGLRQAAGPVCIAAGYFDGVHLGHQEVIRQALDAARACRGEAWALTFDSHPLAVLQPRAAPPLLTSTSQKLRLLARLGLDGCLLLPFTRALAETEPADFLDRLGAAAPGLRHLLMGADWHFGRGGRGDVALLRAWATARGGSVTGVAPVLWHGEPISSTRVRQAITHGHLEAAAAMLGRPFSLLGEVRAGLGLAAHLGFPTANLDPEGDVRPPRGVYAVRAVAGDATYAGVANYGVRPTLVADSPPLLEVHLLDAAPDLYGRRLEVYLFARLRTEERFRSPEALREQIARDADAARATLESPEAKNLWTRTLQTWHPPL